MDRVGGQRDLMWSLKTFGFSYCVTVGCCAEGKSMGSALSCGSEGPQRSSGGVSRLHARRVRLFFINRFTLRFPFDLPDDKMQRGAIKQVTKVTSLKIFYTTVPFLVGANENVVGGPRPMRTPYFCDAIGTAYRFPLRPINSLQIPG